MDNSWGYWKSKYELIYAFEDYYLDKCRDKTALAAHKQANVGLYALEKRMDELAREAIDGEHDE